MLFVRRVLMPILFLAIAIAPTPARADSPRDTMLVSASWLKQHLSDPQLVVLHVGDEAGYAGKHIAGARRISLDDVSATGPSGLHLELPSPDALRTKLSSLGVGDHTRIVLYGQTPTAVTRLYWTLQWAGIADRASVLWGGLAAWTGAGYTVTAEVPPPAKPAALTLHVSDALVADAAYMQSHAHTPGVALVDVRGPGWYEGEKSAALPTEPPVYGHIPGALNVPREVLRADSELPTTANLEASFTAAGIKPGDEVVAYCQVGQNATGLLFIASTLGHKVRLYDGSMEDWLGRKLPLEIPPGKSGPSPAAQRDALMVSTAMLKQHLSDNSLVLLHVGTEAEYKAKHLPGARFVTMDAFAKPVDRSRMPAPGELMLELPDAESLRKSLEALGISNNSHIVIYYGNDWYSPSTRIIWTLDYAGLGGNTLLLDGGMRQWIKDGGPTTADVPPAPAPGKLAPLKTRPEVLADIAYVQQIAGRTGVSLVDGRDAAFFTGEKDGGSGMPGDAPVRGHIPGATNIVFSTLFDDATGHLLPTDQLEAIFAKAGVKPGDEVVAYCHVGQQATAVLFAARTLGHKVRLYDGSMNEWGSRKLPVETSIKKDDRP